jgi:hypothetical protein
MDKIFSRFGVHSYSKLDAAAEAEEERGAGGGGGGGWGEKGGGGNEKSVQFKGRSDQSWVSKVALNPKPQTLNLEQSRS